MNLLRAACAATPKIAILNIICREANDIVPFLSLRSLSIVFAPRASRSVQLVSHCTIERLPHDCFKITYVAKADLKGKVPSRIAEKGLSGTVDVVRRVYKYFEGDEEIDKLNRMNFLAEMDSTPPHTSGERQLLMKTLRYADYNLTGGRVTKNEDVSGMDPAKQIKTEEQKRRWKRIQSVGHGDRDFTIKRFMKFNKVSERRSVETTTTAQARLGSKSTSRAPLLCCRANRRALTPITHFHSLRSSYFIMAPHCRHLGAGRSCRVGESDSNGPRQFEGGFSVALALHLSTREKLT